MRVIFIFLLALVSTAQAQQINPVPDYIFRNQMSVGRNGVTDTAAYMSIGPRFGAVKGFMPPMVTDTNAVTGVKRNGLLIFSKQLNNFAYWDSTTARFRKITAEASVDSLIYATRAWRQKGDDSLGAIIAVKTDTGLISTRAYRQKGIDSVVTLISTLGGGTVLAVSAGTGMAFTTITTSGAVNADTLVLSTRAWRQKAVDSVGAIVGTKVNISDTATMLGAYLRKVDTTAMLTPYLRKVDTTAMLTPYVRAAGFGLVKSTYTLLADTAAMATRARVQKGIDSVAGLFTSPDTLILSTRAWRQKGDDSLGVIIGTKATATGTTNYLSKFTGTSALGNSIVYGTTNEIGISTSTPSEKLDVNGRVRVRTIDSTGTGINMLYSDVDGVIKKAAIPASGSGTVTSVATGFGLSGGTITTTGTLIVDTSAIATRLRVQKGIDSVASVRVGGSGTLNYIPKYTASGTIGNSRIIDSITKGGIGTQPVPAEDVNFWSVKTSSNSVARGFQSYVNFSGNYGATAIDNYINVNSSTNYDHIAVNQNLFKVEGSAVASTGVHAITASGIYNGTNTTSIGTLLRLGDISGTGTITDKYAIYQTSGLKSHIAGNLFKDGKIAINSSSTSSPSFALTINAAANTLIDYQLNASNFAYTGIASSMFTGGGNGLALSVNSGNKIILGAAGVRFATFESNGNVLIGTSTDGGQKLQIDGTARIAQSAFLATTSGGVGVGTTTAHSKFIVNTTTNENVSLGSLSSIPTGRTLILQTTSAGGAIETYQSTTSSYMNTIFNASGGDVLFGTTNDVGNYKHQVIGNAYINGGVVMAEDSGSVGISTTSPSEKLDINGRTRIRTIDSTATGMNMLYADANGVIKKSAVPSGLTMADDVMTASGSWVATKDAGSGVTINNVAYTTNGTTKMVTIDGSFYIAEASFSENSWVDVATIPSGYRPSKTVNWNNDFIVSGAEYERADNTDFTGALGWVMSQMRIKDDGTVQINADFDTNSIAAGGTAYILIQFTQSYIIK